jgi:hypothetical protein
MEGSSSEGVNREQQRRTPAFSNIEPPNANATPRTIGHPVFPIGPGLKESVRSALAELQGHGIHLNDVKPGTVEFLDEGE